MQPINPKDKPYPFKKGSQCDRIVQYLLTGRPIQNSEIPKISLFVAHGAN